ncbi:Stk1 family PASTA domain-containing Ser/Thr kinase [Corynebacterium lubricantis]|uniref:Stk1 family PASTA domain-containing Ser/Thr kinase n=1 Tax=Corynebacterium lubricantis TaxID=541095 RepID=UPI00037BF83E|nr:Stk1 family PASTA domain-containing Ser/Thr kinase [Corynebacterium lubricantis]
MTLVGDRYELKESIGTGGMSDVYAATDTLLGREIAIKMLKVDMARDENFRERFRREAQNSARLNHPNIVAVYDTGSYNVDGIDVPFIVMERVNGRNLRDIVREDGVLTPEEAARFLYPVTLALQASHDAGIIHRDVKPANIMVTNTGAVKVMDFGIARALDDSTAQMTQTSAVIGTAQYLSPEQARGKPADGRSDIYALGCVMYESVTGRPPFEGETPFAVAYQHVQEDPEEPSGFIADLTPQQAVNVDSVILTAMAKHPADRYQTATEMGEDLQRLERGAVTAAARTHVTDPSDAPTTVSGAVPAAAAGAAGAGAASASDETRYGQHRAENSRPANRWLKWIAALLALVALGFGVAFAVDYFRQNEEQPIAETMITVPDVTGMSRSEAQTMLIDLGFQVEIAHAASSDVEENHVIRSNPSAGSQLRAGTQVTLTVSSGSEVVSVPDLTGMSAQQAAQVLSDAGLQLDQNLQEENSSSVGQGQIIRQSPSAGTELAVGSAVSVVVSAGPVPTTTEEEEVMVRIPSLVGMSSQAAQSTLDSLGLSARFTPIDSNRPEGEVISVEGEGTEVKEGSTVNIQISNGQVMSMPDIRRMTPDQARSALTQAGWAGQLETGAPIPTGALVDEGLIGGFTPEAGAEIRRNSTITVRLWEFDAAALLPSGL